MRDLPDISKHKIVLHGLDYKGWGFRVSPSLILFPGSLLSGYSDLKVLTPSGPVIPGRVVLDETIGLGCLTIEVGSLTTLASIPVSTGAPSLYMNAFADHGDFIRDSASLASGQYYWGFDEQGRLLNYSWIKNGCHQQVELESWLKPILDDQAGLESKWVQEHIINRPYRPSGMPHLVEEVIEAMGHIPVFCRNGRRAWLCEVGSAKMVLSYHEDPAILTVELRLAGIGPETRLRDLMFFLLRQNYTLPGYYFGFHQNAVFIALEIPARFLSVAHMGPFLQGLLNLSDQFDNQLVDQYKAVW